MRIYWDFYNTPQGKQFCKASLDPNNRDSDFSFNLVVHREGDKTCMVASKNFISGAECYGLMVEAQPDQKIILLIKNNRGEERRITFIVDEYWVAGGDLTHSKTIVDCKELFIKK